MMSKRDELLEVASQLFYEQGYAATGIKQIIDTAGIAKGTFYSHFQSKEELGLSWLQKRQSDWDAWLEGALAKGRSPRTKILGLFEHLKEWMPQCDYRGCAFLNTLPELPDAECGMRQEILDHKVGFRDIILDLAIEHFAKEPQSWSKQKGMAIFLLFEGALVSGQNFRDPGPLVAAKNEVASILGQSSDG